MRLQHLVQSYANSRLCVTIEMAWNDWRARRVAFKTMYDTPDPLYLEALTELLEDLKGGPQYQEHELYFVAVLVCSDHTSGQDDF